MINKIWDKVGISVSSLCLLHCLATPLLLILFPAASFTWLENEIIHQVFAAMVITAAIMAISPHWKTFKRKDIIIQAFIGVLLILSAMFYFHDFGALYEVLLTALGSLLLISAHYKNLKIKFFTKAKQKFNFAPLTDKHKHENCCGHDSH
jgi:hypothetical protein